MTNFPPQAITGKTEPDFDIKEAEQTLYTSLLKAAWRVGAGRTVLTDTAGNPKTSEMTFRKLLAFTNILAAKLARQTRPGERVGVMMPNVNAALAVFFALSRLGRVPAMVPFIVDPENAEACCATAGVQTVITARTFLEKAADQGNHQPAHICTRLKKAGVKIIYVDNLARHEVGLLDKLKGLLTAQLDLWGMHRRVTTPDQEAVVLFTSGSEGQPKGVSLTHKNIIANHLQCKARMPLSADGDVLFNALPNFHCFGLLTATLLPLFEGIPVFMHANPKDAEAIPGYYAQSRATLSFATNSFLEAYAAEVCREGCAYSPETFKHLKYVWAGAEALKEETRKHWLEVFGVEVLQGYGVTETAPVIAFNDPDGHKPTSVGRLVGGSDYALVPVDGIGDGKSKDSIGELYVRGPHVMEGYIHPGDNGRVTVPEEGWHKTGDIVSMDPDGYLFIKGRLSRFIKFKGEKVPLSVCENVAKSLWPDASHGAGKCQDKKQNETIILFTTEKDANLTDLKAEMKRQNYPLRHLPGKLVVVEAVPLLGNGKQDLKGLDSLAADHC